jgi:anthranilate/para-aminobenzoate synthase component II
VPSPFTATRYHSLVIAPESLPPELRVTARSEDDEIMAVAHRTHPVVGVQFHPESALTEHGYWLVDHFLHGDRERESPLPDRADLAFAPADPVR